MAKQKKAAKKAATKSNKKITSKKAISKKAVPKKAAAKKTVPPSVIPSTTMPGGSRGFTLAEAGVVVLTVTFTGVAENNSLVTAKFNGEESSRTSSGTITFSGVSQNDLIIIDGKSPGNTNIKISVPATPPELNFQPGIFDDSFVID